MHHYHHMAHHHTVHAVNMTEGSPLKLILTLALPLIVTNVGQQLYGIADAVIIGRGAGVHGFAAVGACDWLIWAILWAAQGLTQGFSSLVAQNFGAGRLREMRRAVCMCARLCLIIGLSVTVVFVVLARSLLVMLNTPGDIIQDAYIYLTIIYCGTIMVIGYNMASAILRAVGDGKTPLLAMLIAACTNIVLNLIFVVKLNFGIGGAAFATIIAQTLAFLFCMVEIRRSDLFEFELADWKWDKDMAKEMCRIGIPLALGNSIVVIGGIATQAVTNLYGAIFVAGCTAATKFHGLLDCSAVAIGFATATFVGQNYGAKRLDRVRKGIKQATVIALISAVVIMIVMIFAEKPLVGLLLDKTMEHADMALEVAYEYVAVMTEMLIAAYLMYLFKYSLQGLGNSIAPMLSGVLEVGVRIFVAYVLVDQFGSHALFYRDGAAWILAAVFMIICFIFTLKKRERILSEL
ncbi:MAG TPA: MATE family efflux transporter [Candidatus Alectryocaccobium stercorigallinarum]|nr:MATE family efflux transporter [Candidatus Alectryocaccobium stercorigallinarum]